MNVFKIKKYTIFLFLIIINKYTMILTSRADMPVFGLIDASVLVSSEILLFSIALGKFPFAFGLINITKRVSFHVKKNIQYK